MDRSFELQEAERTDSFCYVSPQTGLLHSLKNKCIDDFEEILKNSIHKKLIDINFVYEDPDNKSLLDIACSSTGNCKFVNSLLKYGADVNQVNKIYKKTPVHFAVEYSDFDTVKVLIENENVDINLADKTGNTALHLAVLRNKFSIVELLLKHRAVQVDKINRKNQSPLLIALEKGNLQITSLLLKNVNIDLDRIKNFDGYSARDLILNKFPEMELNVLKKTNESGNINLFSLLYNRDLRSFLSNIAADKSQIDFDDGSYTCLQYACRYGLPEFVEPLIKFGANPNKCCLTNYRSPILIAAYEGYYEIVRILVESGNISFEPMNGETVLHAALIGMMTCRPQLGASTAGRDHFKCVEYFLNDVLSDKLDVNFPDKKGNTALHYAVKVSNVNIISLLLEKGAYIGHKNKFGEMPIRFIDAKILENYLDESIASNEKLPAEEDYEIIYKYGLFAPPKICMSFDKKNVLQFSPEIGVDTEDYEIISETEPLVEISAVSELRPLLKHPIITSFLNLKWYTIRTYFWVNVIFYLLFWAFLTIYVLFFYGPAVSGKITANATNQDEINNIQNSNRNGTFLWFLMLIFSGMLFVREFFQLSVSPCRYVKSPENWLEIGIILSTFMILLCNAYCSNIKSQIAAIAILLSWTELVLLIGRHPLLSTNIEMFKVVTYNFLKFLAWYSILILAFAFSFYLLFKDEKSEQTDGVEFFSDPVSSIFKSVIMLTGEFDAGSIPFKVHPGTSHLLFVLFVFLIAIVLFNLLNGLAVSDTQAIRTDAELVGIVCRAKLFTYIETMATSDPFSCLSILDKITCLCCCVPIRKNTISRKKHIKVLYQNINLFPHIFPNREARVLPNQGNRVIRCNSNGKKKRKNVDSNCSKTCEWFIDANIIKASKSILRKLNLFNMPNQIDSKMNLQYLNEYKEKILALEESSKRTEQKLSEIMSILKKKL
ncbi:hypothetical protein PGB90_009862 [Kerria lacca]